MFSLATRFAAGGSRRAGPRAPAPHVSATRGAPVWLLAAVAIGALAQDVQAQAAAGVAASAGAAAAAQAPAAAGNPAGGADATDQHAPVTMPPLFERYILDELKALRMEQQALRADMARELAATQLQATDRAVDYTTSTVNNVFFIITAAASILVLAGWNTLRDVKSRIDDVVAARINEVSDDYEQRLTTLEDRLRRRSEELIRAQEEITRTNTSHALWMRCNLESTPHSRLEVLDQILTLNPEDVEALGYKADAVLAIGEPRWALDLCNRALALDSDYSGGYWQRACALATLDRVGEAIADIRRAIDLTPTLALDLCEEKAFDELRQTAAFQEAFGDLLEEQGVTAKLEPQPQPQPSYLHQAG